MTTNQKTIIIKPITAQLTRNTDLFKNMDPYVKFTLGANKAKSSVHKRAGKTPNWKDEITMKYMNEDTLKIEVWDKDTFKPDDLVGSTNISLSAIGAQKDKFEDWIELTYKGKNAGKILLNMQFLVPASMLSITTSSNTPSTSKSRQMTESAHQHHSDLPEQNDFYQPAAKFQPGEWPQDLPFEKTESVFVPQHKLK